MPFRHINILCQGKKLKLLTHTKLASGKKHDYIITVSCRPVNEERITVTPYFLPHKNMMDEDNKLIEQMDGQDGMTRKGFFVFEMKD